MKKGISQEGLKILACLTMLLDHIGAVFVRGYTLRIIGRIAFPIYCFLLVEGVLHTKNPRRYGLRLGIGLLLSEIPFDLLFFGALTLKYQSVMVTLVVGFLMLLLMQRMPYQWLKYVLVFPFAYAAEWLHSDYGGWGIAMIAIFALIRDLPFAWLPQLSAMAIICYCMDSLIIPVGTARIPIEMFALLAMLPISLYRGRKLTDRRWVQWCFYLFYPVHLTVLYLIQILITH